ncbi:MAG TPA: anthranilate synthase component I family protein, partial [Polyangiaceae bacterium]|nr:anthranilate synthase component I family protein [Polyangiaceae bacterium]
RLSAHGPLTFLWSADASGPSFIGLHPSAWSERFDPEPELELCAGSSELSSAPRWIGLLPYEACRKLERTAWTRTPDPRAEPHVRGPLWQRFGAVVCVGERVSVVGDDAHCVRELANQLLVSSAHERASEPPRLTPLPGEPPGLHAERVSAALELIRAGQIYQVNLARRLDFAARGRAVDLLEWLCREQRPRFAAALRWNHPSLGGELTVVSTSPELLLEQRADGRLLTRPIKGTRPRGRDATEDRQLAQELADDPKEHAELSMVIDVERNDLGRVSSVGSVRVRSPRVVAQGPVWHRCADVIGRVRPGVTRSELLDAILPSGSVTGAPKVRAMEVIAGLEAERRGLYTGGFGLLNHRGELQLAMAIRTLSLRDGLGHYFSGGGIVGDSQPEREVEETRWKAQQLFGRAV